jgi:hypothetical protein
MYTWHTASSLKSSVKVMTKIFITSILHRVHILALLQFAAQLWWRGKVSSLQEGTEFSETDRTHCSSSEVSPQDVATLTATLPRFWGIWRKDPSLGPLREGKNFFI